MWVSRIGTWSRRQPWSARAVALFGLLLALVTAFDQFAPEGWQDRLGFDDWGGWTALGLTVAVLFASTWFGRDVRRVQRWSDRARELDVRLGELAALHPDALGAALRSVHDADGADRRAAGLADVVDLLAGEVDEQNAVPSNELLDRLAAAIDDAVTPSKASGDPVWNDDREAAVAGPWRALVGVRTATRRAIREREAIGRDIVVALVDADDLARDPRSRWSELIGLAAVVGGLIAAPAVADTLIEVNDQPSSELADEQPADAGAGDADPTIIELRVEVDRLVADVVELRDRQDDSVGALTEAVAGLSGAIEGWSPGSSVEVDLSEVNTLLTEISDRLAVRRDLELFGPVQPGDTLWAIATEACANGNARETLDDLYRTWAANTGTLGADPDALAVGSWIAVECVDPDADGG